MEAPTNWVKYNCDAAFLGEILHGGSKEKGSHGNLGA